MKNFLHATTVTAVVAFSGSNALAQVNDFTGFNAGVNLNLIGASTEISSGANKFSLGETSNTMSLQAGYSFNLDGNGVLGLGASYHIGEIAAGTVTAGTNLYKLRMKNLYSIYFEPGYVVNKSLFYGKLAYLNGKGEESLNALSGTETFTGMGYGVGLRTLLDKKTYVQVEIMQSSFSEKSVGTSNYKPSATLATFGIGMTF